MKKLIKAILILIIACVIFIGDKENLFSLANGEEEMSTLSGANKKIKTILDDESKMAKDLFGDMNSDRIYTIVLSTFEKQGEWTPHMSTDKGLISARMLKGTPVELVAGLKDGEDATSAEDTNKVTTVEVTRPKYWKPDLSYEYRYKDEPDNHEYVLGVKVCFQKRDYSAFSITSAVPIQLAGIVKNFEIWVCGRNKNHQLYVVVRDIKGEKKYIRMGRLNFLGWRRLVARVPDGVIQYDSAFTMKRGLTVIGLYVKCSPLETYGRYYIYFDNFSAEVSRFFEEYRGVRGWFRDQRFRAGDLPDAW